MSSNETPNKNLLASPAKFVKPADLFKMRRRTSSNFGTPNNSNSRTSPIKGSSSSTRSSPVKAFVNSSTSNHMIQLTPNKNSLKPIHFSPRPFQIESQSPLKCLNNVTDPSPTKKLPVLLRNPFNQPVKRRLNLFSPRKDGSSGSSTNNRSVPNKRTRLLEIDEDANLEPPKMKHTSLQANNTIHQCSNKSFLRQQQQCYTNDWTIKSKIRINLEDSAEKIVSLDAIKESSTVYQHPYLAWLPLFPRMANHGDNPYKLSKNSIPARMMQDDWCKSFKDLIDLLLDNRCPYFYLCSDTNNILFRNNRENSKVTAHITPFYYNMGLEISKMGIKYECPESRKNSSYSRLDQENSQSTSYSLSSRDTNSINFDENSSQAAIKSSKLTTSDSGNYSDLLDDEFGIDENDEDASTCLESLGLSTHDFKLISKPGGFQDTNGSTRVKTTSTKPLASIEGSENILKLAKLLQSNRTYTITNVGKFASIPPTLLAPIQFRSSTLQNLDITKIKNESSTTIEVEGVVLPNLFKKLHTLLPFEHTCSSDYHISSKPFIDLSPNED